MCPWEKSLMAFLLIQRNNIIKIWHYVKKKSCLKVKTACGNLLIYEHVSECSHVMCISRNRLVEARTMTTESFLHIEASKSVRWYQSLYLLCLFQSLVIVIVVFVCFCFCQFTGWIRNQKVTRSYQSYWIQLFLYSFYRLELLQ